MEKMRKKEKVFIFHTPNNCTWEIFLGRGVKREKLFEKGVEKEFFLAKKKSFTIHASKTEHRKFENRPPNSKKKKKKKKKNVFLSLI